MRIGDNRADVIAAHPGATLVESRLTDIYVVAGSSGNLFIEVASRSTPDEDEYWGSIDVPDGRVLYLHAASTARGVVSLAATESPGGCGVR